MNQNAFEIRGLNLWYGSHHALHDVDIDIPAMLRPLIGPQMQKVADQFGSAMGNIAGL